MPADSTAGMAKSGNSMSFFRSIAAAYRNYFNFAGRSNRRDFWYWLGFAALAWIALLQFDLQTVAEWLDYLPGEDGVPRYFSNGWLALNIVPLAGLIVRRVHDHDRPGWMALTVLPLAYWLIAKGTPGPNRYG